MNKQEIEKAIRVLKCQINDLTSTLIEESQYPFRSSIERQIESLEIAISALEQQLNDGWIPVSDRLPEIRSYENGEPVEYNIMIKGAEVPTTGCINNYGVWGEMCWAKAEFYPFVNEVIAWQPLPEPYKEDKDATD